MTEPPTSTEGNASAPKPTKRWLHPAFIRLLFGAALPTLVVVFGGLVLWGLGRGRWSVWEALYFSVISVSTAGFGELDGLPSVPYARLVTVFVITAGLGAVAYFQSTLTAFLVENVLGDFLRKNRMKKRIEAMSQHVVLAGIGSTGRMVAEELWATGTNFVVVDRNLEALRRASAEITGNEMAYVHGDAAEDHTLVAAGVERASAVISALTQDRDNLYVTLSARSLNPKARIVTKVVEPEAERKMLRAGANATVSPNAIGGRRLAAQTLQPGAVEFLDSMLHNRDKSLRFFDVSVPEQSPLVGRSLSEIRSITGARVLVVAIRDAQRKFQFLPGPSDRVQANTVLITLAESEEVRRLTDALGGEATGESH